MIGWAGESSRGLLNNGSSTVRALDVTGADLPHVLSRFGALLRAIPTHSNIAAKLRSLFSTHNKASMALFVSDCMQQTALVAGP